MAEEAERLEVEVNRLRHAVEDDRDAERRDPDLAGGGSVDPEMGGRLPGRRMAPLLYVAGPYRGAGPEVVARNVAQARDIAVRLMLEGYAVICPHSMTHGMEFYQGLADGHFLRNGLEQLRRCDGIVLLPGWGQSAGSCEEYNHAMLWGMPVFLWPAQEQDVASVLDLMRKVLFWGKAQTGAAEAKPRGQAWGPYDLERMRSYLHDLTGVRIGIDRAGEPERVGGWTTYATYRFERVDLTAGESTAGERRGSDGGAAEERRGTATADGGEASPPNPLSCNGQERGEVSEKADGDGGETARMGAGETPAAPGKATADGTDGSGRDARGPSTADGGETAGGLESPPHAGGVPEMAVVAADDVAVEQAAEEGML